MICQIPFVGCDRPCQTKDEEKRKWIAEWMPNFRHFHAILMHACVSSIWLICMQWLRCSDGNAGQRQQQMRNFKKRKETKWKEKSLYLLRLVEQRNTPQYFDFLNCRQIADTANSLTANASSFIWASTMAGANELNANYNVHCELCVCAKQNTTPFGHCAKQWTVSLMAVVSRIMLLRRHWGERFMGYGIPTSHIRCIRT